MTKAEERRAFLQAQSATQPQTNTQPTQTMTKAELRRMQLQQPETIPNIETSTPQITPYANHGAVAQQGHQNIAQKQAGIAANVTKPMTTYLQNGGSININDTASLAQLARERGMPEDNIRYLQGRQQASTLPSMQTQYKPLPGSTTPVAIPNSGYDPVKSYDIGYGNKEAQKTLNNLKMNNDDRSASTYVDAKANLEKAQEKGDLRNIAKNQAIVDNYEKMYKSNYNKEWDKLKGSDIKSLEEHVQGAAEDLTKSYEKLNTSTGENLRRAYDEYKRDLDRYNEVKSRYDEAITYDELINNNPIKDFGKGFLVGAPGAVAKGMTYSKLSEDALLDFFGSARNPANINANSLLNYNNKNYETDKYSGVLERTAGDTDVTGEYQNMSPASAFNRLKQLAENNPEYRGLQTLLREISTHSYKGTAEDLAKELDRISREMYQGWKNTHTQAGFDWEQAQQEHNERAYGDNPVLKGIVNSSITTSEMLPSVAAGFVGQPASMATLFASAAGGAADQAINQGATINQGTLYGALSGATEVGTEMIGGENVNRALGIRGQSLLSKVFGDSLKNLHINSKAAKAALGLIFDVAGEMTEEGIAQAIEPLTKTLVYDPNAMPENVGEYFKDIFDAAIEAIPSTLLMEGMGGATNVIRINQVENGIINRINESDLSPIIKNQLTNEVRKASRDVKLGLEQSDYIEKRTNERYSTLQAQSEQMKQRIPQGYTLPQSTVDILAYTENNRPGLTIAFDNTIKGNGNFIDNGDGTRTITLNPNSKRAVEFVLTHELGHDLKGTAEYTQLQNLLMDYAKGKPNYQKSLNALDKTYRESGANYNLQDEATNDMLGEAIGEQEFYNKLAENPTLFNRVTSELKNLLGNKDTKLKNKIEKLTRNALKQEYRGEQQGTQQSISDVTDSQGRQLTVDQENYFKDSKVRDDNGNLIPVYHGTNTDFTVFNQGDGALGKGIYFAESKDYAKGHSQNGKIIEAYLDIKNPYVTDYPGNYNQEELKAKGYDGIYHTGNKFWVAFEPNQVKNTNNLTPTTSEDIRYSLSEADETAPTKDSKGRTLTLEQQDFFKGISPEMLDSNGNIVTLYHASPNQFDTFDKNRIRSGVTMYANSGDGFYFTDSQKQADRYGKGTGTIYEVYLNLKHPLVVENNLTDEAKQVLTDFSNLMLERHKAEIEKEDFGRYEKFDPDRVGQRSGGAILSSVVRNYGDEFTEYLKSKGYDGIKESITDYNNTGTKYDYIAFEPEQIKDVTNKKPTSNPNIHYSLSEEAPTQDNQGRQLSKGQQSYFKDSKVRDEKGNLLELYHGSNSEFTIFDISKGGQSNKTARVGFWFTESPTGAGNFANETWYGDNKPTTYSVYLNIKNPKVYEQTDTTSKIEKIRNDIDSRKKELGIIADKHQYDNLPTVPQTISWMDSFGYSLEKMLDGNNLTEAQIREYENDIKQYRKLGQEIKQLDKQLDNLGYDDSYEQFKTDIYKMAGKTARDANFGGIGMQLENEKEVVEKFRNKLIAEGYDGIIIKGTRFDTDTLGENNNQYVAFYPEQIKNTDNLNPTDNEDIRYQKSNGTWQQFLEDNFNWAKGTKTRFEDLLPSNEQLQQQETKGIENEPIVQTNKVTADTARHERQQAEKMMAEENDGTLFSLSEEEQKEINDYADKLFEDKTLDENYVTDVYDRLKRVQNYTDFEDIKQEVSDYKDKMYKGISSLADIANLKPEDIKQREMTYKQRKDKNTTNQRKFFENVETSPIIAEQTKNNVNATTYETQGNIETLNEMRDKLDERGNDLVEEWKTKTKNFTAKDVALGAVLIERYQQDGDWASAARTVEKLADMGTEAGRAVQMYSIFQRLSPETMAIYQQKALDQAFEDMKKKKTGKWVEANKDKFKLTAEDTQFIYEQVEKASQAIDEETKQRELSKIENRINEKLPPEAGQSIKALRRIAMLFNPKTQVRNIVGNTLIMPVNDVADFVGSLIDKLVSRWSKIRTTSSPNLITKAKGFKKGIKDAITDYKTGTRTTATGSKYEFDIGAKPFNENTGSKVRNAINRKLNGINDLLSAVMSGGDRPFYEAAYKNSLEGQMKANNVSEPTPEMVDIAVNEALQRTWNDDNEYTNFVLGVRRGMNKINVHGFGFGDLIIPFAKTPANLTKAIVEYSPAGFVKSVIDFNDMRKAISRGELTPMQQKKFVSSMSKAIAGTMLYAIAGTLARTGAITGSADDDKDVKNFEQNVLGIQPYSVRLGDKTFTYSWANPINAPLAIMADQYKMQKENAKLADRLYDYFKVAGNVLLENSFLQGVQELFGNQDGIMGGIIESIESMPEQLIPTFMSQIASLGDDTQRQTFEYKDEAKTVANRLKSKIPGARNTLEAQVNTFGEEIENQNNAFNAFLNPANVKEARITDEQKALYDVYQETKDKTIFPMQAPYYVANDMGEKQNLSSKDRYDYQKASGQFVTDVYEDLFKNNRFNEASNEEKVAILHEIATDGNVKGKEAVGASKESTNSNLDRLNERNELLEEANIPLADYYIAWYAKNHKPQGSTYAAKQDAIRDNTDLTPEQEDVLFGIFNIEYKKGSK